MTLTYAKLICTRSICGADLVLDYMATDIKTKENAVKINVNSFIEGVAKNNSKTKMTATKLIKFF